jgi:hypothetical protein
MLYCSYVPQFHAQNCNSIPLISYLSVPKQDVINFNVFLLFLIDLFHLLIVANRNQNHNIVRKHFSKFQCAPLPPLPQYYFNCRYRYIWSSLFIITFLFSEDFLISRFLLCQMKLHEKRPDQNMFLESSCVSICCIYDLILFSRQQNCTYSRMSPAARSRLVSLTRFLNYH